MLTTRATQVLTSQGPGADGLYRQDIGNTSARTTSPTLRRVIIPLKLSEEVFKMPSIGARRLSSLGLMGSAPNGFGDQLDQSFTVI